MPKKKGAKRSPMQSRGLDFEGVREMAMAFPDVEEGTSYGTPAFRVRKKLMARMWEDLETVVVPVDWDQRDTLLETDPEAFFLTDHYRDHPYVCIRVAAVPRAALFEVLEGAWRRGASKRQIAAYDQAACADGHS